MKNEKYYVGLDIGTDSVGYAVTNERYDLCKFRGEPMWGVTLFDEAQLAAERRTYRVARRRLDRRQQRVKLIMDLFASEIAKVDPDFFRRIKESYLYPESQEQKVRLFGTYEEQKSYIELYPTIHHLIVDLMKNDSPHDVRLVYVACAWLVAHRGHFLSDVDKHNIDAVLDFRKVYDKLVEHITRDGYALPWSMDIDTLEIEEALKAKIGKSKKAKLLVETLFDGGKAPKTVNEVYEYNYEIVTKLLCGGKDSLEKLFDKEEYAALEEKSVALNMDDEVLAGILQTIEEDDAELIRRLKEVYDWSVLVDVLKGKSTISEAKVAVYEQHQKDLRLLKDLLKAYAPDRYGEVFRSKDKPSNYVAYVGKNMTVGEKAKVKKAKSKEDFCKYILSVVKSITPDPDDAITYQNMIARLEINDFLPKQVEGDNRVIPYQLYWYELSKILEKAQAYIPFLAEEDGDGITGAEKILSVFEFRVPYYVGPLKENPQHDLKKNCWMVRLAEGKIYPWNFDHMVDHDASERNFIDRMTNSCSYLPGEDVLPKNSLVYSSFEVLNEINNIKINGNSIPVEVKQGLYQDVFMRHDKVTVNRIKQYLEASGIVRREGYVLSGLDVTVKSSLRSHRAFRNLVGNGLLTYRDVEAIITHATYSEDKNRFKDWLRREYVHLPDSEIKYISSLRFKDFGRLSRKLLCGIEGAVNHSTGEYMSIIRTMWETNFNLMELLSDQFDFMKEIERITKEYYDQHPKSISDRLDEMYVSNAVKRPIIRTLDILKDIVKAQGKRHPDMIFIEMARGASEDQKGKRTTTRRDQILDFYKKIDTEEVRQLTHLLEEWGDSAHNKLQSDKLFLYFLQLGRCLYTNTPIDLEKLLSGDGTYNIEHIYPRSFVKDDSVINNKILVDSKANGEKRDRYPIDPAIREKMRSFWICLNQRGLISDEKYKRLIRSTGFTEEEKYEFINRQLVETRQSTKVVASLLKEIYPETVIVYVKAGLVSDFRQQFDLLKSRVVNDLHHAKDAYLSIVVGNVWYHKFSRQFWRAGETHNAKPEVVFTHAVKVGDRVVWNGATDKERVVRIARKNTAHMTLYPYLNHSGQNGGFFDQNPLRAKAGLIPLKKNMPTEIYGGYDSATIAGFVLVRYRIGKKAEVSLVPLKYLHLKQYLENDLFASQYVAEELGAKASGIEILLNGRIMKIGTMISLDGARFCIRGKANLTSIGLMNMMPFMTSYDLEVYIKKLEVFDRKRQKNANIVWDEGHDGISREGNAVLYSVYVDKLSKWPYNKRPGIGTLVEKLRKRKNEFLQLDVIQQTSVLLQVQGILGRMKQADLERLSESSSSGIAKLSLNVSNWQKNYTDVRIIDQSASGLFEKISEVNLLELL